MFGVLWTIKWDACSISYRTAQAGLPHGFPRAFRSRHAFIYPFTSGHHGGAALAELKLNEQLLMWPFQWPIHGPTWPPPHSWIFKCISWALSGWGARAWDGHIWRSLEISDPHAHTGQGMSAIYMWMCVSCEEPGWGEGLRAWLSTMFSSFMTLSGVHKEQPGEINASQPKVSFLPLGTGRVRLIKSNSDVSSFGGRIFIHIIHQIG